MTTTFLRILWVCGTLLFGVITGISGGALAWLGGDNPAKAIMTGAATFAATLTLVLLILNFVGVGGASPAVNRRKR